MINNNKFNFKIFFISTLLFILLPIFFIFCGCIYHNVLKIKTNDINMEIKKELQNKTILEKKDELKTAEQNISDYIDENVDYDTYINNLNNEITNKKRKKNDLIMTINNKTTKKNQLDIKKNNLELKFKKISTHEIKNVKTINQYPLYPNGCEAVSLTILLNYYNIDVTVDEVIDALPIGKTLYYKNGILYGGNPNYEFLGDPKSSSGWGIWDQGLAATANKFKNQIINGSGMDFKKIIKLVRENRPVIVWTSINLAEPHVFKSWIYEPTGEKIIWKNYNHAVVVVGYSENIVIVSDPINGKIRKFNKQKFIDVYNYMGKRAIYY